ncbi:dirigent protein 22-like [Zingiber officinale]|uniref:Dirigent protein n=1 Tax=Zingiber officinale TaxID=94328 RepID=A0A8J5KVZ0_ZINOF|nr:dirigent protein 22-like [Zingiber officinale]KAG6495222.1 hypothetical protein ZIOFF_043016 [Zingiber officinale]
MAAASSSPYPFLLLLLLLLFFLFPANGAAASADESGDYIRFYIHEKNLGTANSTLVYSVDLHPGGSPAGFGNIIVFNSVIREEADPASPAIGIEQGFGVSSSLAQDSGLTVLELLFTAGQYQGTSLSVFGLVKASGEEVERGIVGGTGRFRYARGYVLSRVVGGTKETLVWELDAHVLRHGV